MTGRAIVSWGQTEVCAGAGARPLPAVCYTISMASAVDIGTLIVRTPGTLGGRPRIDGTRISVATIALLVAHGESPEYIVHEKYEHLTLGQVYAALAYYHSNREEIDADIADEFRFGTEQGKAARRNGQGTVRA